MQDIESVGLLFLKGVVVPALGMIAVYLAARMPKWIAAHVDDKRVAGIIERLASLSFTVVNEVQQTVVARLRRDEESIPHDQLRAARDQAIATLKSHLGSKGLLEIRDAMQLSDDSAVEKLLTSFIESAVLMLKQQEPRV